MESTIVCGATGHIAVFLWQGNDTWDADFVDKFTDTFVVNLTLLAEEPMP